MIGPRPKQLDVRDNEGNIAPSGSVLQGGTRPNWSGASPLLARVTDGRLSLDNVEFLSVPPANMAAKEEIFYVPHIGATISLHDGTNWGYYSFDPYISKPLSENDIDGSPLSPDSNYDVYIYASGGTPTLAFQPWSSSGAGSSTRSVFPTLYDGVYVRGVDPTMRYLGTFRTSNSPDPIQVDMISTRMFLWNAYNQVPRSIIGTHNSSFSSAVNVGPIPWGNSGAPMSQFQVGFVLGLPARCRCDLLASAFTSGTGSNRAAIYVGLNSTNSVASGSMSTGEQVIPISNTYVTLSANYDQITDQGYHYFQALWSAVVSNTNVGFASGDYGPPGMVITIDG